MGKMVYTKPPNSRNCEPGTMDEDTNAPPLSPQSNGNCERFYKTILNKFYQTTVRKRVYGDLETPQKDLDE